MKHGKCCIGLVLISIHLLLTPLPVSGGDVYLNLGGVRGNKPVRSLQEIRWAHTVRQRWDNSCGSAALSTILTHHYQDKTSEAVIIMSILRRTDPVKIRAKGGFSLLDLKRFVESKGYLGRGYADLNLEELVGLGAPAIVPVVMRGYDHFVVFRGIRGNRVVLSDPAFGNVTMTVDRFLGMWKGGIGFVALKPPSAPPARGLDPKPEEIVIPVDGFVARSALDIRPVPLSRRNH
jgi:hypothetical protein